MVDVRDDGHVSDVGGLVCEPFLSATAAQSCDENDSRISRSFFTALFTQANGKLLTHKRTDLVDSEARAFVSTDSRCSVDDGCQRHCEARRGRSETRYSQIITTRLLLSPTVSTSSAVFSAVLFSLLAEGFTHPYLQLRE